MDTTQFLQELFPQKPAHLNICIGTLKEGSKYKANFFKSVESAAKFALKQQDTNVYFTLCLLPDLTEGRGSAKDAQGIGFVYADIDYGTAGHKAENIFPDQSEALAFLESVEPSPSIIVSSGHGLHAYWLFKDYWLFEGNDTARLGAAALTAKWDKWLKSLTTYRLDSVFDLARVLRVPGTQNVKDPAHPQPCEVIAAPLTRYDLQDLQAVVAHINLDEVKSGSRGAAGEFKQSGKYTLDAQATPPQDKHEALMRSSSKYKGTFERTKKYKDTTPSSYDYQLCWLLLNQDWTAQEIINTMIASRRFAGQDLKIDRDDYYERTLLKAERDIRGKEEKEEREREQEAKRKDLNEARVNHKDSGPEEKRAILLKVVSEHLGIGINRVIRYLSSPYSFAIEVVQASGEIEFIKLGEVTNLISYGKLKSKIAASLLKIINKVDEDTWEEIAQALLEAVEDEVLADEATYVGKARGLLRRYLNEYPPKAYQELPRENNLPFAHRDGVAFYMVHFKEALQLSKAANEDFTDLSILLKTAGVTFIPIAFKATENQPRTNRHAAFVPAALVGELGVDIIKEVTE